MMITRQRDNQRVLKDQKYHEKRAIMLPMLCSRPSIKDVLIRPMNDTSSDPASPKITCIGQLKRTSNNNNNKNKVVVFPNPIFSNNNHVPNNKVVAVNKKSSANSNNNKLKRFFSGKNYTREEKRSEDHRGVNVNVFNVAELDPPLPVVIKKRPISINNNDDSNNNNNVQEYHENSLWQRRSGGNTNLKTLQLNRIQLPIHRLQPTTV